MSLLQKFIENIRSESLFDSDALLLVATSGGVDSVALCELCYRSGYKFVIAHCNFQLREEESERDENFVRSLASSYGCPIAVKRFDTAGYAKENKVSIQVAARELRYSWFYELLSGGTGSLSPAPDYLLTAHHADDAIETILMNFFKGTGIAGLRGMVARQGKIIRPLLPFYKEELLRFVSGQGLHFVEDSSNASDKYSRNFIRHQLIPLVRGRYPNAEANILDNTRRFAEIEILYMQAIGLHKKKLLEPKGNEVHIPVLKLKKAIPIRSIIYEIISEYHFTPHQTEEVMALLSAASGRYVQSSTHRIIRNREWLIIAPRATEESAHILIEEQDTLVRSGSFSLQIEKGQKEITDISGDSLVGWLDAKFLKFPLLLRRWKAGDYFYPLGMKKKKKLARFFIDQKLSKTEKENIWVLESDRKIVWVVGHRIDDRFRITDSTRQYYRITCQHG